MALLLFLVVNLFDGSPSNVVWLDLRREVEVRGTRITLGDLCDIDALDAGAKARCARIEVARAREPRERLVFSRESLSRLLEQQGFKSDGIAWQGAEKCSVQLEWTRVDGKQIEARAIEHLKQALAGIDGVQEVSVTQIPASIDVPVARYSLELSPEPLAGSKNLHGLVQVSMRIMVDGDLVGRVPVSCQVRRTGSVVVVKRRVPNKTPITLEDIDLETRELGRFGVDVVMDPNEVIGLLSTGPLVPGQVLTKRDVRATPIIRKGDVLNARLRSGGLTLDVVVVARQEAAQGERILVENADSKKTLWARVVDSRTVEVALN